VSGRASIDGSSSSSSSSSTTAAERQQHVSCTVRSSWCVGVVSRDGLGLLALAVQHTGSASSAREQRELLLWDKLGLVIAIVESFMQYATVVTLL
jgi:hypothetical protein